MLSEYTREELGTGLDTVIEELLAQAGIEEPPVDAWVVARALGLSIVWDELQEGRARYVRLNDRRTSRARGTILLRPDPRGERRHWAVAHEIGEHMASRVFAVWGVDPRETIPTAREAVANAMAGRLLLPTCWFESDGRDVVWDLFEMKQRYRTASHELIARRMLECRPAVVITIFDNGRATFRRGNRGGRVPPPSTDEIACWREVQERIHPSERRTDSMNIAGWPVHEDGWKREILRSELIEWE